MTFKNILLIIISLSFFLLIVNNINTREIERWDEYTNIQVVNETIKSDNPLILKYNNSHFFEKPPLWYYATMTLVTILGNDLWVYRIISVISILTIYILSIKYIVNKYGINKGLLFSLLFFFIPQIYTINPDNYFASHTFNSADLDAFQILFIFLSFYFLLLIKNIKDKRNNIKILLSSLSLSIAFLIKGPFVLIPLVLNIFYLLLILKFNIKIIIKYLIIFIIPILIWLILMIISFNTSFIDSFINYHILSRSITTLEGHNEPFYFYFKIFINPNMNLLFIPFILKTILLIKMVLKGRRINKIHIYSFLLIFITILFFSLIGTKLAWYILPIYPFLALFIAI